MEGAPDRSPQLEIVDGGDGGGGGGGGTAASGSRETSKSSLFKLAMQDKWAEIISIYRDKPEVQIKMITHSMDTVLHIAVSQGDNDVVKQLLDAVAKRSPELVKGTLLMQNEKGNTPLHLAAYQGMVEVCTAIAKWSPEELVKARNNRGETPLFLAAKHGKREAFLALQDAIDPGGDLSFCRDRKGVTILHAAIAGEYFDMAFEIIELYGPLVNYNNERGESPLHYLANKPYVFKSWSRMRLFETIIYHCTFVDPLEVRCLRKKGKTDYHSPETIEGSTILPKNYKTCYDAFELMKLFFNTIFSGFSSRKAKQCFIITDEERPGRDNNKSWLTSSLTNSPVVRQNELENQESIDMVNKFPSSSFNQRWYPKNYETCIDIFKLVMKFLLVVLGIGFSSTLEIAKNKKKHIHACQIMDKLIASSSSWEYEKDGKKPSKSTSDNFPSWEEIANIDNYDEPGSKKEESERGASTAETANYSSRDMLKKILDNFSLAVKPDMSSKNIVVLGNNETSSNNPDGASAILVAAKRGVKEMVEKILDSFPIAVKDVDGDDKNIVLLAVEHRQPHVYKLMQKRRNIMKDVVFGKVDKEGNSALHFAATLAEERPWNIPGAALQMQWEIKWYKFVLESMDLDFFPQHNYKGEAATDIFTSKHEQLVKSGGTWLNNTSQSCSVVAALIATVAFASATTVPGGTKQKSGLPTLEGRPGFDLFAISALVALCFSVTSLIMFLSILTSRYHEWDFEYDLPIKLILGLTSLFMSIAAMLASFCAGNFYVVEKNLKYVSYPIYAVMCLPVTFFAVAQFPLYVDLIKATFGHVPERKRRTRSII